MHLKIPICRDHTVKALQTATYREHVGNHLAAIDTLMEKRRDRNEVRRRQAEELTRLVGEENDKLNSFKRKRDAVKMDEDLPKGLKKARALLEALTNDDETPRQQVNTSIVITGEHSSQQ